MKQKMNKEKQKEFLKDIDVYEVTDDKNDEDYGYYGYGRNYEIDDGYYSYYDRSINKKVLIDGKAMDTIWKEEEEAAEEMIDTLLDLTPETRAYFISLLIEEGEGDLVNACLKESLKDKKELEKTTKK